MDNTHTHNRFTALWILSGTTRVSWYQKKHSPTHTYHGYQSSLICFICLIWSMALSLFNPRGWQSFSTISLQVFFGLPLGLAPSTSYSIHFFTQSLSPFRNTCPYHRSLFCCGKWVAIFVWTECVFAMHFSGSEYESHTKCISEEEKYSGKNYKPKPNANKGEIKQELWTQVFNCILFCITIKVECLVIYSLYFNCSWCTP